MFSLCIPTINRYDTFLKRYLPKYIANPLISEIIITDETGSDVVAIQAELSSPKLRLYVNDTRLGPLLNKHKALKLATCDWIALIDSDNFADEDYFIAAKKFIEANNPSETSILAPEFAAPGDNTFQFTNHGGFAFKQFVNMNLTLNALRGLPSHLKRDTTLLMNVGNYIVNRHIVSNFTMEKEDPAMISHSSSFDVIYFNTMLYEQFPLNLFVVDSMVYKHSVHDGSVYLTTHQNNQHYSNILHNRYYAMIN